MKKVILAICAIILLCGCEIREIDDRKTNNDSLTENR